MVNKLQLTCLRVSDYTTPLAQIAAASPDLEKQGFFFKL
jgi:hypothetical protein